MTKRPFNIFPSIGYKNSQFQILSTADNLTLEIFHRGKLTKTISTTSESIELIHKLDQSGIYTAKCIFQGKNYEQKIEVRDAFRLGDSEFKKAFVFDNSDYSFLLMKDRLLLYDENKGILLTENHYSPTKILQIDNTHFLFLTELGISTNGIVNFGMYNIDSFSIVGELLDDFQVIQILPESNKVWVFRKSKESIHCFELVNNKSGNIFSEIRKYENASQYSYNSENGRIYIEQDDKIIFIDTHNLHRSFEVAKTSNNAIDKVGNNLVRNGNNVKCTNEIDEYNTSMDYSEKLNLISSEYLHVGSNFQSSNQFTDLTDICDEIKNELISSSPDKTYFNHSLPDKEVRKETIVQQHHILPTYKGLFVIREETERKFYGLKLSKIKGKWSASPKTINTSIFTLSFHNGSTTQIQVDPTTLFSRNKYDKGCLIAEVDDKTYLFKGEEKILFSNECSLSFHLIGKNSYLLEKKQNLCSLYSTSNLQHPILKQVEIHNIDFIDLHQIIWYSGNKKFASNAKYLNALDLSSTLPLYLDEKRAQHSLFKDASEYQFKEGYILSSNEIIIDPKSAEIKDSSIGTIESYSKGLNKIVSHRTNHIYLSKYNSTSKKYEEIEIKLDESKFRESYLSPNGQFLVLQGDSNKYLWYDIEKNEKVRFLSGNFLAFSKEGNLIIKEDGTRAVKIFDPITFSYITRIRSKNNGNQVFCFIKSASVTLFWS